MTDQQIQQIMNEEQKEEQNFKLENSKFTFIQQSQIL